MKKMVWVLAALSVVASIFVAVVGSADSDGSAAWAAQNIAWSLLPAAYAVSAALILGRQPRNLIGWLLMVPAVGYLSGVLVGNWVNGLDSAPATVTPGLIAALAYDNFNWILLIFPIFHLLLTFPTGRLLSPRWRWVVVLEVVMVTVMAVVSVFVQPISPFSGEWSVDNPIGIVPASIFDEGFLDAWIPGLIIVTIAGFVSMVMRFRRAERVERQQIKWLLFAVSIFVVVYTIGAITAVWDESETGSWFSILFILLPVSLMGIGVAIAFAVLRYGLFDIDHIISRTVAYTLVVATLTGAYLAVILGVGALATSVSPPDVDLPIPVVATALVAIGFQPVRKRALRIADRLVFGKQRTPYEALAGIKDVELDDLLPRIAQLVTESTAARGAVVWLSTGTELEPAAVFPDGVTASGPRPLTEGQIPDSPNSDGIFPLLHKGSLIGAITILMDPGEELPAGDVRLLEDLASHAATTINGVLEAIPLPDGIVTFLMTDIEGSTRLWEEDPERMAVALREHDKLAQRLIREGGGVLVKWKGEGDSTFSVFTDPGEAVEAAMALQEAIHSYQWDLVRPISIRAALHTGEAELRDRDYYGQTVNRCARIRSLGHGGQTLVSAATRELVRSASPEALTFTDLGEQQLKDFTEPQRVYEVTTQTRVAPTDPKQAIET